MRKLLDPVCSGLAAALVLFQLVMIGVARVDEGRYFTWTPHDVLWAYRVTVELPGGETLFHPQARKRYGFRRPEHQEHAIEHVFRAIERYETTLGEGVGARVRVNYRRNGGPARVWDWPKVP